MRKILAATISTLTLTGCAIHPAPLSPDDRAAFAKFLEENITADQEAPVEAIDLYEAMARALKYNLDHRVAMMEVSLAKRDFKLARYELLPQIVANAGYNGRNNDPGASSLSLLTGRQSLEPSTSTRRNVFTSDLYASWNILDFGLSYIRARQLGDETLIYEERRRKAINQIIEEVRGAYWRAASADRLSRELVKIKKQANDAYENSRRLYTNRQTSPYAALSYQRELNDILAESQEIQRELMISKKRLATLMNMPAGQDFDIVLPDRQQIPVIFELSLGEAISAALNNRPEIREAAYRIRMGDRDMTKALVEALPGVELYGVLNYDSNDFLFNNDWVTYGARASWNVIRVFETPARRKRAKSQLVVDRERALATAMAVTSQVHISMVTHAALRDSLVTAQRAQQVQRQILNYVEVAAQSRKTGSQTLVRERMNMIIAEARYDIAHADVENAFAAIYTSLGYDPFGPDITGAEDIKTLTASLQKLWQSRQAAPDASGS